MNGTIKQNRKNQLKRTEHVKTYDGFNREELNEMRETYEITSSSQDKERESSRGLQDEANINRLIFDFSFDNSINFFLPNKKPSQLIWEIQYILSELDQQF